MVHYRVPLSHIQRTSTYDIYSHIHSCTGRVLSMDIFSDLPCKKLKIPSQLDDSQLRSQITGGWSSENLSSLQDLMKAAQSFAVQMHFSSVSRVLQAGHRGLEANLLISYHDCVWYLRKSINCQERRIFCHQQILYLLLATCVYYYLERVSTDLQHKISIVEY